MMLSEAIRQLAALLAGRVGVVELAEFVGLGRKELAYFTD